MLYAAIEGDKLILCPDPTGLQNSSKRNLLYFVYTGLTCEGWERELWTEYRVHVVTLGGEEGEGARARERGGGEGERCRQRDRCTGRSARVRTMKDIYIYIYIYI